ncbi:MAG: hypothetical protein R3228_03470 [Halioglobus sp.]|nr:hypothetical protein [Halioglobus sp.]
MRPRPGLHCEVCRREGLAAGRDRRGIGMLEFLVALAVFATAAVALQGAQLAGKRLQHDALQRSRAVALARDMLVHIQASGVDASRYEVTNAGDPLRPAAPVTADCARIACTAQQLAAYDLWQWQRALAGAGERRAQEWAGGLLRPRACIVVHAGVATVTINWRSMAPGGDSGAAGCAGNVAGIYDAPDWAPGNRRHLREVSVSAYVGAAP